MDKLTGQFIADVFSQATKPKTKKEFLSVLAAALPNNSQFADTKLVESVTKTAATDPDRDVRKAAQQTLGVIVAKRPELADTALTVTKIAATDPDRDVRKAAQQTLGVIVAKRPELANTALTVTKTAATDPEWQVRYAAQQTLGVIVAKCPELADTALTVTKTAATDPKWQVRVAAQQTLGVIVAKRPELADTAQVISPDERLLELAQSIKSLPATRPIHPMAAKMSQSALNS